MLVMLREGETDRALSSLCLDALAVLLRGYSVPGMPGVCVCVRARWGSPPITERCESERFVPLSFSCSVLHPLPLARSQGVFGQVWRSPNTPTRIPTTTRVKHLLDAPQA